MYHNGKGVKQDDAEALKWVQKAADQNDADAQYNLGVMYYKGQGVKQDDAEAVKWVQKAADLGFKPAQEKLEELKRKENLPNSDVESI
jgi:TPR repeat protein